MRTTIELDDEVRAALQRKALERGERGYSEIINEILRLHLATETAAARERRVKVAEELRGSWTEEEAAEAKARIRELRANWRDPQRQ